MRNLAGVIPHRRTPPESVATLDARMLIETTTDNVCLVDHEWRITYLKRKIAGATGSQAAIGGNLWKTFPHLLDTEFETAYRRAMDERVSTRTEAYCAPLDTWFIAYAHPVPQGIVIHFRDVTLEKQSRAALRASQRRFRQLFESLTQGVILHDATGKVIDVNPAAERITGRSLEQLRYIHAGEPGGAVDEDGVPLPPAKRPSIVALTTGLPVENCVMGVMHPKLRELRWLNVHAIPIFEEGEATPHQVYALFADVTARKQTEMALRASEARLNRITYNLPIAVFERVLTRDGKISYPYYNARTLVRPAGGDLESGDGPLWTQVHPEDRKPFAEKVRASTRDLSLLSTEFRLVNADGGVRWMQSNSMPRRLENGDTLWEGFAIDVSGRKEIEEALRASEAKARRSEAHLTRAQRVAGIGSSEVDFRTGDWVCSDELYRIYGLRKDPDIPLKDPLNAAVHPEDGERYTAALASIMRGEDVPPLEFRIVRPDGEVRTIYREVEIIRDDAGTAIGAVATRRDVTELRRAEREREQLREELLHAQRMDALGRLAGGIAHDVNNTLVPVIGLTEAVLKDVAPDSPEAEALAVVLDAGLRAKSLVQQILTFSRRDPPDRRPVDLARFLGDTIPFLRAMVPTTIDIETQIETVPPVDADSGQLHQLILNLVTNSVDAIGAAKGTIGVRLYPAEPGIVGARDCVELSVIDSGSGMDATVQKQIFEPFFTTKDVDKGTGLGLSVVYGIVCAHDGRIELMSEPGKGTRFDIFLPASTPEAQGGE